MHPWESSGNDFGLKLRTQRNQRRGRGCNYFPQLAKLLLTIGYSYSSTRQTQRVRSLRVAT